MRVKIAPGAELDVLNKQELHEVLHEVLAHFRSDESERVRPQENGLTDGTGAAAIVVYQVPIGMGFRLSRITVSADGFTFAAKFTNAAGAIELRRGGQLVDGVNLNPSAAAGDQSVGIPWVETYSGSVRPAFQNGEQVAVNVVGGPPNTNVNVLLEGDLYPLKRA